MCGIAGIISFTNKIDHSRIDIITNSISHRGPDQKKIFKSKNSVFGFVRLKIIDLSDNSNQPFSSHDNKIHIIYNGEIYNFRELKDQFFSNQRFKSKGDGEIRIHFYQKFGSNFIEKRKGMF